MISTAAIGAVPCSWKLEAGWLDGETGAGSAKKTVSAGDNELNPAGWNRGKIEGHIPEIDLVCLKEHVDKVIAHHGFLVVAASDSKLIGMVNRATGEIAPLTRRILETYSTRARLFPGYGESLLSEVRRARPESGPIRLLFLCTTQREEEVVEQQRVFARRLNIPLSDIALMHGNYDRYGQINFTRAHLHDGRVVSG